MYKQLFILILVLYSCSNREDSGISTELAKQECTELTVRDKNDISSEAAVNDDTIFIKRELTKDFYHAIYLDTTRDSEYYDRLTDFEFNKYDLQTYSEHYRYVKENKPKTFEKVNLTKIPENWIPVYSYKGDYYLYSPSDWGSAGRRIINDSTFVYWYMDGPFPVPLVDVSEVEYGKIVLEMMKLFNGKSFNEKLIIHQIDSKTGLSVFEFAEESESNKYQLYLPVESARKFDMVINYCDNQKQLEFDFDKIDFEELIKEATNNSYK